MANSSKNVGFFLGIRFDHEVGISRGSIVLIGLAFDKSTHSSDVLVGRIPFLVDLVARPSEVVVGVVEWNFLLVGASADLEGFVVDGVVGIGVGIAEGNVFQVIDACVKVPVTGDIVKGMVFHHEVDYILDLARGKRGSA